MKKNTKKAEKKSVKRKNKDGKEKDMKKKMIEEEEMDEEGESEEEIAHDLDDAEEEIKKLGAVISGMSSEDVVRKVEIKASKLVSQLKKGDKVKVDGAEFVIDAHYVLMDHGKTKEMAIEIFNLKTDKDYQLRYFTDQLETSMEFYELQEILYVKRPVQRVEW